MKNPINFFLLFFMFSFCGLAAKENKEKDSSGETLEEQLHDCALLSPSQWHKEMQFVFLADKVALSLIPEMPLETADTIQMRGTLWTYDSMVTEEDWMGQQLLQLRFCSPAGRYYRYSTGRSLSSFSDTTYIPALSVMYPASIVHDVDSILRARTYYLLYNDERVIYPADSAVTAAVIHQKFVPVRIDSVSYGIETAPLRVDFSVNEQMHGYFYTSLPGSREMSTSTPINRFLSMTDPYLSHPDITSQVWSQIQVSQIQLDMTSEEVRLAWGRPSRVERGASRTGYIEYWYYSNNRIIQFWDGRLSKIGVL